MRKLKKKRKLKRKFKMILLLLIILFFILVIYPKLKNNYFIKDIAYINNKIEVSLKKDNLSCILSDTFPTLDSTWIKSNDKKCFLDYKNSSNLYILSNKKIYNMSKNIINYIDMLDKDTIYIATSDKVKYINIFIGNKDKLKINNLNKDIAYLDSNGYINAVSNGKTSIIVKYNKIEKQVNVISSDLIISKKSEFNHSKANLTCNIYSKEDNDLLDTILRDRINDAGYKTRAGAVEAARFLMLEFPYKISYFYENGRITTNKIDGEGRYYHEGLYLHESRYNNISKSTSSPKTWGCSLYSKPIKANDSNGLDCSGFVSWVLLNAGFDIKDIGAGFKDGKNNDLTDYGDIVKLNTQTNTNNIKVGDLLHSNHSGGHIAIIVGINDNNYYVAQALWNYAPTSLTKRNTNSHYVQITKYTKNEMIKVFNEVILMDKYYINDGKLTDMW